MRTGLYKIILSLTFFLILKGASAQDPNFHIYLCFGQSNMEGNGTIEAQDLTGVNSRFQVVGAVNCSQGGKSYTLGKWQTATPPLVRCNTGLSPIDYFGRTMVANLPSTIKVGVVPVAIGGCDIALFDKVNYGSYVATAPSWMQGNITAYGGNPYARLVEVAKLAQKEGVIKGILLHQGETNNGQTNWPVKIKAIYDNLIKDLNLDPTKTPLLAGELVTTAQGGACGYHNTIIATLPKVIPNSYVISAAGLPHKGDNLHFTPASYRTLGQRYADKMLTLLPKSVAPTVSITSPAGNSSFTTLQNIAITANASDADGSIAKVEFYDGATLLGSDNSAPFAFNWSGMTAGTHTITAKATDNAGAITTSSGIIINIQVKQASFNGKLLSIPGRIEAEDYDLGGEGVAFHETNSNGNEGKSTYRNDQVDIETTGDLDGAYNVGYILQDEWLEYTVNIASTRSYDLDLRVAKDGAGGVLHIEIDGVNVTGPVTIPNTGGWQKWQTVSLPDISLAAGTHIMRLAFDASYMNLNYVEFNDVITGTENSESAGIDLYPNPFTENGIHIRLQEKSSYYIQDMAGRIAENGILEKDDIVGVNLASGIYILIIRNESGTKSFKITRR